MSYKRLELVCDRRKSKGYEHEVGYEVGHLTENEMDWGEVTDFVKIPDRFNEPLFIDVHGLMDKTLIESNIEVESVRTTSFRGVQT